MTAAAIIGPKFYGFDNNGDRLAGGKVFAYEPGTTTPKATYTDETATTANAHPVVLNAAGFASIYLVGTYKIVLKDASDVEIWTADPVTDATQLATEWIKSTPATQASPTTFTVDGNQTEVFVEGRRVRLKDSAVLYGYVSSASYVSPTTTVTVVTDDGGALTASLSEVRVSNDTPLSAVNYLTTATGSQPIKAALNSRVIYVDTIADLQALPVGELVDGQSAKTQEGDYVWDAAKSEWVEAPIVDVPLRRETEWMRAGRLKEQLEAMAPTRNSFTKLRFNKRNADEFEVSLPWWKPGQYLAHRFNKNDAAFDDGLTLSRPFRQTLIRPDELTQRRLFDPSSYLSFVNTTLNYSSGYYWFDGMGSYVEFTLDHLKELSIVVLKRPDAPIIRVTLNGQDDLADQITLTGGEALIDLYAGSTGSATIPIASNLPQGTKYKVRFEIVDQNASSTGTRTYFGEDGGFRAIQFYDGSKLIFTETSLGEVKQLSSATEYAIGFRPEADVNASTPFIGSGHGYEEIISRELYFDDELIDYDSLPDGHWAAPETISLVQKTAIKHPDYLSTTYAEVTHAHRLNKDGLQQSYNWEWVQDVNVRNGYTQMFTYGGSVNSLSADFARRAIFRGRDTSRLLLADDSGAAIRALTDEVVVTGDPDVTTTDATRPYARDIACLVSIGDLEQSMEGFENDLAYEDAAWMNDRNTFRKLYFQPFRNAGLRQAGSVFRGKMAVKYYIAPELCESLV